MEKTNMEMAMGALGDELKGLGEYEVMMKVTTCPELKKIFIGAIKDERVHASALFTWLNSAVSKVLK